MSDARALNDRITSLLLEEKARNVDLAELRQCLDNAQAENKHLRRKVVIFKNFGGMVARLLQNDDRQSDVEILDDIFDVLSSTTTEVIQLENEVQDG